MEKDHFKDRPRQSEEVKSIEYCMKHEIPVMICIKAMQTTAMNIEDLTTGQITKILTKHDHPRGIKNVVKTVH